MSDESEEIAVLEKETPSMGRRVSLIGRSEFTTMVSAAIASSLTKHLQGSQLSMRHALERHLRGEILGGMRDRARVTRAFKKCEFLQELERTKDLMLLRRQRARDELGHWTRLAEIYRDSVANQREELLRESAQRGERDDQALQTEIRNLFASARLGSIDMAELHGKIEALALEATHQERERTNAERTAEHRLEVDLFRRRITKLTSSLGRMEQAIQDLEELPESEGIESIHRIAEEAELEDEQRHAQRKGMMEAVYRTNVELYESFAAQGAAENEARAA